MCNMTNVSENTYGGANVHMVCASDGSYVHAIRICACVLCVVYVCMRMRVCGGVCVSVCLGMVNQREGRERG